MVIIQYNLSGKGQPDIEQTVYDSLHGFLIPACRLPWVENIFVPGHPCHEEYHQMRVAYDRLLERLNEVDENPDAERMIMHMMDYSRIIAMEMFRYGRKYQEMIDSGR